MRLNSRGQAVAGRTTVHVDGVVPPALLGVVAGNPQWLTDTTIVCQALVGDYRLVTLDVTDPHAQLQVVDPRGQTHLFAGAGVWARHLNGYLDSLGMVDPEAAPVAVDNTSGHVAVAAGRGSRLEVWAPTLITYIGPPPDSWEPNDIHYRDGLLAFRRDGYGETYPQRRMARVKGQGIRVAGGAVLTYQQSRGLVIHWDASLVGIALHLDPKDGEQDFSPDMIARPDGTLLVKSCRGEGELPNELREYAIDLVRYTVNGESRPVVDLSQPAVITPTPTPTPTPEPTPEDPPMSDISAREITEIVTAAKAEVEALGHKFSTRAEVEARGFTAEDRKRALLVTMRAAWELAKRYPNAGIGLEAYGGQSGEPSPFVADGAEKYSFDIVLLSQNGPSVDILGAGVEPAAMVDDATDPETIAAWRRDWRAPLNPYRGQAPGPTPVPVPVPTPTPTPTPSPSPAPTPCTVDLAPLMGEIARLHAELDELKALVRSVAQRAEPPIYKGTASNRLLGTVSFTLTPQ